MVLPGPLGRKVVRQSSARGVCLDIKHQAATSAGLIKTLQFPVVCLMPEREEEKALSNVHPVPSKGLDIHEEQSYSVFIYDP